MLSLSRKALVLMAVILAVATAATAATAFAGPGKKKLLIVNKEVAEAIHEAADAARRSKVRRLQVLRPNQEIVRPQPPR